MSHDPTTCPDCRKPVLAQCETCGVDVTEDSGSPCGGCGWGYCTEHFPTHHREQVSDAQAADCRAEILESEARS